MIYCYYLSRRQTTGNNASLLTSQVSNSSLRPSTDEIHIPLTLKMSTAQVRNVSHCVNNSHIPAGLYPLERSHSTYLDRTLGFPPFTVFNFSQRFSFDASERLCWQFKLRNSHPVHEVRLRTIPFWRCTLLLAYAVTQNNKWSLTSCQAPLRNILPLLLVACQLSDKCHFFHRTPVKKRLPF